MSFDLNIHDAYAWISRFIALYIIIDSFENISIQKEFANEGIYSWQYFRKALFFTKQAVVIKKALNLVYSHHSWVSILMLRACCGIGLLLLPFHNQITFISLSVLVIIGLLMNLRNKPIGTETQNRMGLMIIIILFIYALYPTETIGITGLWFISLQAIFSYFTAGIFKFMNKEWRNGDAMISILSSTTSIGSPKMLFFFENNRQFGKWLCWLTIIMECSYPLVLLGGPLLYFYLIWGGVFHLTIALVLRINLFIWVWLATYPAIIFTAQ